MSQGKVFSRFGSKEWIEYYDSLNSEVPVEELRLELADEEKKAYSEDLAKLKEERKTCPWISYEVKYSWFD